MSTSQSLSMKLRAIIIDDEPIALEKLRSYVEKTPFLQLAGAYTNGIEALETMASGTEVDVVFTDINMPDINGMEMISALTHQPLVVFITAYSDYAAESYRYSAVDYLLKPYNFTDFQRAAGKVLDRYRLIHSDVTTSGQETPAGTAQPVNDSGSIFIKVDHRYVRVNLADIRYIKGYGEYLQIFISSSPSPLLTLSSFATILGRLSADFLQIHRSYIVNMNHVLQIERARIVMDADTYLPVGDSYKPRLQQYLAARSIGGAARKE